MATTDSTPDWTRVLLLALAGAVAGLLVGLLLVALDVIENPFWVMSAGIFLASIGSSRVARRPR